MSTEEKMDAYIQKTKMTDTTRYELNLSEVQAFRRIILSGKMVEALELAFNYGRAKGFRMAKREAPKC